MCLHLWRLPLPPAAHRQTVNPRLIGFLEGLLVDTGHHPLPAGQGKPVVDGALIVDGIVLEDGAGGDQQVAQLLCGEGDPAVLGGGGSQEGAVLPIPFDPPFPCKNPGIRYN